MSSENITERYVKAHVVVKLQQEHKLIKYKSARRVQQKAAKSARLVAFRRRLQRKSQKAHVVRGVRKRKWSYQPEVPVSDDQDVTLWSPF